MTAYEKMPDPFFVRLDVKAGEKPRLDLPCAGYDGSEWRGKALVNHLMSWLPDYALDDDQLRRFSHASGWEQFREAAVRIYTTKYSELRGEIGEICLHAICRRHFGTVPLVPRVFYLSSSNEVVKGFDLVHYRLPEDDAIELWLGESKFYRNRKDAIAAAIHSVRLHLDHGFLKNDKLIIGPQIPSTTPRYSEIRALFKDNTPIDQLKAKAVFPVGIFAESDAIKGNTSHCEAYLESVSLELEELANAVISSGLAEDVSIVLIYVPLRTKAEIIETFDTKLKAIQDG